MYERSYGSKYERGADYLSAADIAKKMRADIKELQAKGQLSKSVKVSVTVENYSMGRSVNITVPYSADFWVVCDRTVPGTKHLFDDGEAWAAKSCPQPWAHTEGAEPHEVLSIEGQRVKKLLDEVHWAYNYDGSETMTDYFDVNYYGHVEMTDRRSQEWNDAEKARKAEARRNAKAKAELIDHLLTVHHPLNRRSFSAARKGHLVQLSYDKLLKLHAQFDCEG